jgi:predicted DNA-binding protein YlxM (UPF0122 family)
MFEKDMHFALLLDAYGDLLSEHRREIFELYYSEDLSLSEIAENTGISRQGVRESIKKTESELLRWEEKLGLVARQEALHTDAERHAALLESLSAALPQDRKPIADEVVRYLRTLHF